MEESLLTVLKRMWYAAALITNRPLGAVRQKSLLQLD
jgi:hypothetical protein